MLNAGFKLSEENLRQHVYEVNKAVKEIKSENSSLRGIEFLK